MFEYGVLIGRFQPFHVSHLEIVKFALERAEKLVIIIGSSNSARNPKNPWTADERINMIGNSLTEAEEARVIYIKGRDYLYNDNRWVANIQQQVKSVIGNSKDVALFGYEKDKSSFYLNLFPQWRFVDTGKRSDIDATWVRRLYFEHDRTSIKPVLPAPVYNYLCQFESTDKYKDLYDYHRYVVNYRNMWDPALNKDIPYKVIFNTVDAIVTGLGHVLVVRRGKANGRGQLALPGGFLNQDEDTLDGAIRELKEETRIALRPGSLKDVLVDEHVFKHPNRSLIGRVITHAYHFNMEKFQKYSVMPEVKGDDDAADAFWLPISEIQERETEFFEDHAHILDYFLNNSNTNLTTSYLRS
jgi:bifunctional NMN adenylyltransferase/nudix hydrolase